MAYTLLVHADVHLSCAFCRGSIKVWQPGPSDGTRFDLAVDSCETCIRHLVTLAHVAADFLAGRCSREALAEAVRAVENR